MKLLLKSVCIAFVLTVVYSVIPFQATCKDIQNDVFRLHVIANSDSEGDQQLKLRVRDRVLEKSSKLFEKAKSREEAETLVANHLSELAKTASSEIKKSGYTYSVKAEITNMRFPTRYYDNYTLPSGNYDALRLTIGEGKGHNWWCVMFPTVCISREPDKQAQKALSKEEYRVVREEKTEYKFKIVEIFEGILSAFNG